MFDWPDPSVPTADPIQLVTYTAPLRLTWYATALLALQLTGTYAYQRVDRLPISSWASGEESFLTVDFRADVRLPRRKGFVSVELRNSTNNDFQYQDDNFRSPETRLAPCLPERSAVLRVSLYF